jgi:hypothetical protein
MMTRDSSGAVDSAVALRAQRELIEALRSPAAYPHPVEAVRLIETHSSFVLLTGDHAYKVKKAVNLGFLDYSTLERRRHFCQEELRLNRRLAPQIYQDAVPIRGPAQAPRVAGTGSSVDDPIEYAVRMKEFAQEAQFDRLLAAGRLGPAHLDSLVATLVRFHAAAAAAGPDDDYGTPDSVRAPMERNFAQLGPLLHGGEAAARLAAIAGWSEAEQARLVPVFARRRALGRIRECHGDLHLGNIALVDGAAQVFDCIEFDPALRWIDVISEIAFLVMDLGERGRPDHAARVLDDYLEASGDYDGIDVLRYYLVYRAIVRAKVTRIRAAQDGLEPRERAEAVAASDAYLGLALRTVQPDAPALILMHGVTGSGKSVLARALVETLGAIRLRSDLLRRRLHGVADRAPSGSGLGAGIYSEAASDATYGALERWSDRILGAGHSVVVDAACLEARRRQPFRLLAQRRGVPFLIVSCRAAAASLARRITRRAAETTDPSEANLQVLARHLDMPRALIADERGHAVDYDSDTEPVEVCARRVAQRIEAERAAMRDAC